MALTDSQKTSFVYKKAVAQVAETSTAKDFFNEAYTGRDIVFPTQVWNQSDLIPATAPTLADGATSGVVQYFSKRLMTGVSGSTNAYYLSDLVDCIPFGIDASYNPVFYKNDGTTVINFGDSDWVINYAAGTIYFYAGNPSGVSAASPPKISFYKYVGTKGVGGAGIGTNTSINTTGIITAFKFVGDGSGLTNISGGGSSGIATYATSSGVSTNVVGGIASVTQLSVSGVSTFAGIATYTAALFGTTARFSGIVTALNFSGNASSATYASTAGIATYATTAGIATYATNAGLSTNLKGGGALSIPYQSAVDTTVFLTTPFSISALVGSSSTLSWISGSTANRVLRTNGTAISFSQVDLTTDVTGTLPIANGGTNSTATATNGGVAYGTGTAFAFTAAGTAGQVLTSNGSAAPTWQSGGVGIRTSGSIVGVGITLLDFRGSGISTITAPVLGISTINIIGGGGGTNVTISDDTTTNATRYIVFEDSLTGTASTIFVSSSKLTFNPSTGNLVAGGTVTANSDEKLKTNVKTLENSLEKVLSLRGVEFDRIDTKEHQIGVIAQEVEKIIPDVVYPKGPTSDNEIKSVAYGNLVGLLIEAIKEQNLRIDELERRLKEI